VRVVLDNNILVSSLISPYGAPAQLRDAWQSGELSVLTSRDQIDRLDVVLTRTKFAKQLRQEDIRRLLDDLEYSAIRVEPKRDLQASRDPEDNLILGIAVAGQAAYVVTGDKRDLLHLKEVEGVRVITAREALDLLQQRRSTEQA
jgi:putative PIN family toxin of toxin-antitoxin system